MSELGDISPSAVTTHYLAGHQPHARVSQEECERIGGHCFKSDGHVLASNPPQYPETCKHCGKQRIGVPQESMRYYDPSDPKRLQVPRS